MKQKWENPKLVEMGVKNTKEDGDIHIPTPLPVYHEVNCSCCGEAFYFGDTEELHKQAVEACKNHESICVQCPIS